MALGGAHGRLCFFDNGLWDKDVVAWLDAPRPGTVPCLGRASILPLPCTLMEALERGKVAGPGRVVRVGLGGAGRAAGAGGEERVGAGGGAAPVGGVGEAREGPSRGGGGGGGGEGGRGGAPGTMAVSGMMIAVFLVRAESFLVIAGGLWGRLTAGAGGCRAGSWRALAHSGSVVLGGVVEERAEGASWRVLGWRRRVVVL